MSEARTCVIRPRRARCDWPRSNCTTTDAQGVQSRSKLPTSVRILTAAATRHSNSLVRNQLHVCR